MKFWQAKIFRLAFFTPFIIQALLISIFSTQIRVSPTFSGGVLPGFDKIAHLGAYMMWCYLGLWALHKSNRLTKQTSKYLLFLCAFYGFLMETVQYLFFPERFFEKNDILANVIGVFLGQQLFYFFKKN